MTQDTFWEQIIEKIKLAPFVRITTAFIIGIVMEWFALVFLVLLFFRKLSFLRVYVVIVLLGALLRIGEREPKIMPSECMTVSTLRVDEFLSRNYLSCSLIAYSVAGEKTVHEGKGRILLELDTLYSAFLDRYDTIRLKTYIEDINKDKIDANSYRASLERKGYSQLAICYEENEIEIARNLESYKGLKQLTSDIQQRCVEHLNGLELSQKDMGILSAMIAGEREQVDKKVRNMYVEGGISHVLAISGLHVGIVFLFFNLLLKVMDRWYRMKVCKTVLIILLLWGYAFITGLSPSVCRATLMFSLFAVGSLSEIHSEMHRYNILFASAFLILLVRPALLFDVGFQLSYLSVLAILFFIPKIEQVVRIRHGVFRYLFFSVAVTVVVQLFTAPVTLYSFGQFSFVSVLNNVVVTTLLPVILFASLCYMAFPVGFFSIIIRFAFDVINYFLEITLQLPCAGVEEVVFYLSDLFWSFFAIFLIMIAVEISYMAFKEKQLLKTNN